MDIFLVPQEARWKNVRSNAKQNFSDISFSDSIQYKMNEHYNVEGVAPIDVREIIAILIMFSQEIYPYMTAQGTLSETQPIQCYSGKKQV